jgi:hypothetical protein
LETKVVIGKEIITMIKCSRCKKQKIKYVKGMCKTCYGIFYREQNPRKTAKCVKCKKVKPIHAKGMCPTCYKIDLDELNEQIKLKNQKPKQKKTNKANNYDPIAFNKWYS